MSEATQFVATLDNSSPRWDGVPYQTYNFFAHSGTTIALTTTANTLTGSTINLPWYVLNLGSFSGSGPSSTILVNTSLSSIPNVVYSGPSFGNFLYSNFTYILPSTGTYAITVLSAAADIYPLGGITFEIAGTGTLLDVPSGSQTFINNYSYVTKQGAGTAIVQDSLSGTTYVDAGTLQVGSVGNVCAFSGHVVLASGARIQIENVTFGEFTGNFSGTGGAIVANQNNLVISGNITGASTGISFAKSGTLTGSLGASGIAITNDGEGTATISSNVTGSGATILNKNSSTTIINGHITRSDTLITNESGDLTVSGNITNTASINNSGGTLAIQSGSALGNGSIGPTITVTGGSATIASTSINHTAFVNTSGSMTISGNLGDGCTVSNSAPSTLNISGVTSGAGTSVTNYGAATISGNITNNASINNAGGTLAIQSGSALGNGSIGPTITVTGGSATIASTSINHTAFVNTSGSMTISGNLGDGCTVSNSAPSTLNISGVTSGAGTSVTNYGAATISGNVSNNASINNAGGTLAIQSGSALGNGSVGPTITVTGGSATIASTSINHTSFVNTSGSMTISGNLGDSCTISNSAPSTLNISGVASGADMSVTNYGAMTISNNVTGTGNSSITQRAGTMSITGSLTMPTWNIYGGTMTFDGSHKTYAPSQVTFYLGDGDAGGISPVSTGKIIVAGTSNTFSPGTVNVALDTFTVSNVADLVDAAQTNRSWTLIEGVSNTPNLVAPSIGGLFTWQAQKVNNNYVVNIAKTSVAQANVISSPAPSIEIGTNSIAEISSNVSEINATQFRSFAEHAKGVMRQMFWGKASKNEPLSMDGMYMDSLNKPLPIQLTPAHNDSHVYVGGIHIRGKTDAAAGAEASSDMQNGMIMGMDHAFKKAQTYVWGYLGGTIGLLEVDKNRSNKTASKTMLAGINITHGFFKEAEWVNAINSSRTIASAQRSGQVDVNQPITYYHSRIKTDSIGGSTSLAYKFKCKNVANNQTYLSMRPYVGAQATRSIRYAYAEREANGIQRGRLNVDTINGLSGVGFRVRGETTNWTIKTTVSAGVIQQLNKTKIKDKIYSLDTPQGIATDITGTGRTTVTGNFTMNFSKKDAPCKISVALQASRKARRATQSYMLQFTRTF